MFADTGRENMIRRLPSHIIFIHNQLFYYLTSNGLVFLGKIEFHEGHWTKPAALELIDYRCATFRNVFGLLQLQNVMLLIS